ncbi:MAG TPA: hypothetical protein VIS76_00985 [Pseudomonadales bacterium]
MSKYAHAKSAIEQAVAAGTKEGLSRQEMLLALIVSTVDAYRTEAGKRAVREALLYELGEVEGNIDTQFLRSR